jgi:hypothetical protein
MKPIGCKRPSEKESIILRKAKKQWKNPENCAIL